MLRVAILMMMKAGLHTTTEFAYAPTPAPGSASLVQGVAPPIQRATRLGHRLASGSAGPPIQRQYQPWMQSKKKMVDELETDHFALHGQAANTNVQVGANANKMVKALDHNTAHDELNKRLGELLHGVHIRPNTPYHANEEQNLPAGNNADGRRYMELGMEGGGGTRMVVDRHDNNQIYFSYHYGQGQLGANPNTSPFVRLDNLPQSHTHAAHHEVNFFNHMQDAIDEARQTTQSIYAHNSGADAEEAIGKKAKRHAFAGSRKATDRRADALFGGNQVDQHRATTYYKYLNQLESDDAGEFGKLAGTIYRQKVAAAGHV